MTQAAALELRHVRLAEHITLRPAPLGDGQEGVFVALDDSPPVRTVLAVVEGEQRRALEVAWVVEVAERDEHGAPATRGFYGRWVSSDALERAARVGTEHLEDGTPVVQPVIPDHSAVIDLSDTPGLAMPAPVLVLDDDTGVVDTRDYEDDDDDDHAARAAARDPILADTVDYPERAVDESEAGSYYEQPTTVQAEDDVPPAAAAPDASPAAADAATEATAVAMADEAPAAAAPAEHDDAATELAHAPSPDTADAPLAAVPDDGQADAEATPPEDAEAEDAAAATLEAAEASPASSEGDASGSTSKGRKKRGRKRR
jgi:hypothetical protein